MTMLNALQDAIKQLEAEKKEILKKIQKVAWKDDREEKQIIPEKSSIDDAFMLLGVTAEKRLLPNEISSLYQHWYSAGRTILEKNQPSRMAEFESAYAPSGKTPEDGIKRLTGERYVTKPQQFKLMDLIEVQFDIIAAVPTHLKYALHDVELTAYSILMDDEITAARHLLKNGFLRPSGAMVGVILERHLKNLLRKHTPPIKYKEKDALAALNDYCKEAIYDLITWRKIQHLIDLRNLCDHDKEREPTKTEVAELVDGVSAMIKTYN